MGMYTELVFKAEVKSNAPDNVKAVLSSLFNSTATDLTELPDHPFFLCGRWRQIGQSGSYYHIPWASSAYNENYIFSRSDFKNYDDEIEKFIGWVKPYLSTIPGTCIGWSWHEEADQPTLIYM